MKKLYKNQRDEYKAKAKEFENKFNYQTQERERLQRELESIKTKGKEGLSCKLYCSNCQNVYSATVPNGNTIHESGCAYCGVKNTSYLVTKINY